MNFSRYTVIMSLLLFTILAIISIYTIRHANWKSIKFSFLIVLLSIIRFLVPIESFNSNVIRLKLLYPSLDHILRQEYWNGITLLNLLCIIWFIGSIFCLFCLIVRLCKQWKLLKNHPISDTHPIYELYHECARHIGISYKGTIVKHTDCKIPGMIGILHPNLLLPIDFESISKEDLSLIIFHELYHFKSKDQWIKLGVEILCAILWWNPVVYLLKNAIEHVLELRCDKNVCTLLTDDEKTSYSSILLSMAKKQSSTQIVFMSEYIVKKSPSKLNYRIKQILNECKPKISLLQIFLLVLSISLFILSYCFTLQPYSVGPTIEYETTIESPQKNNTFILRQSDGTLMYFENGKHCGILTEDMLKEEPYCDLPIHNGY